MEQSQASEQQARERTRALELELQTLRAQVEKDSAETTQLRDEVQSTKQQLLREQSGKTALEERLTQTEQAKDAVGEELAKSIKLLAELQERALRSEESAKSAA